MSEMFSTRKYTQVRARLKPGKLPLLQCRQSANDTCDKAGKFLSTDGKHNYIVFIGIVSLFVAGIDFIHTLAYKGMGVFQTNEYKRGQLAPFAVLLVFLYTKLFFWSIMSQFLLNRPCSGER